MVHGDLTLFLLRFCSRLFFPTISSKMPVPSLASVEGPNYYTLLPSAATPTVYPGPHSSYPKASCTSVPLLVKWTVVSLCLSPWILLILPVAWHADSFLHRLHPGMPTLSLLPLLCERSHLTFLGIVETLITTKSIISHMASLSFCWQVHSAPKMDSWFVFEMSSCAFIFISLAAPCRFRPLCRIPLARKQSYCFSWCSWTSPVTLLCLSFSCPQFLEKLSKHATLLLLTHFALKKNPRVSVN